VEAIINDENDINACVSTLEILSSGYDSNDNCNSTSELSSGEKNDRRKKN
jgi:hypothetical protein